MKLSDAWLNAVEPEDYEEHMTRVGQAQANAGLVQELLDACPPLAGSRVLMAGAGTGQIFDYLPAGRFANWRLTCSDLNPRFLAKLRQRILCETLVDDVEASALEPGFGLIILVLVLEHVDWRRALASLVTRDPEQFLIVTQQNPPHITTAISPNRQPVGTMRVFAAQAQPQLVPFPELEAELARAGYLLARQTSRPVADGKTMLGAIFRRSTAEPDTRRQLPLF
jgi:SAM-dependent methyltransferase